MTSIEALEKELVDSQTAVTIQGDTVRSLKAALKDGKADKVHPKGYFLITVLCQCRSASLTG
jgi:hypothetical protein